MVKKKVNLSVGRGEKLPASKGAPTAKAFKKSAKTAKK